jgi:hypothetical protein
MTLKMPFGNPWGIRVSIIVRAGICPTPVSVTYMAKRPPDALEAMPDGAGPVHAAPVEPELETSPSETPPA